MQLIKLTAIGVFMIVNNCVVFNKFQAIDLLRFVLSERNTVDFCIILHTAPEMTSHSFGWNNKQGSQIDETVDFKKPLHGKIQSLLMPIKVFGHTIAYAYGFKQQ
jgi:hypothetical protein